VKPRASDKEPGAEFDTGGLRPFEGEFRTPFLQRLLEMLRAEKHPNFAFLQRDPIPFQRLRAPLEHARVALLTTAGLHRVGEPRFRVLEEPLGDPSFRVVPQDLPAEQFDLEALYVDRKYTVDDPEVALPRKALAALADAGRIGSAAPRHFSFCAGLVRPFPGLRASVEELRPMLVEDRVDALLLLPTCSVCVQTTALLAGEFEALGFPTVALSMLPELSQIVGAPRTLSVHFPYGAPCGDPFHPELHRAVLLEALALLENCSQPGEVFASTHPWRERATS
jgi:D-proline reductase (dithiol) PrdB